MKLERRIATVVAIFLAVKGLFFAGVVVAVEQPSSVEGGNASNHWPRSRTPISGDSTLTWVEGQSATITG